MALEVKVSVASPAAADPASRLRSKGIAALFMIASLAFVAYQLWIIHSNAAAEREFRASESCAFLFADPTKPAPEGACRREFVTIIARRKSGSSRRSWPDYYLVTRSPTGVEETSRLTSYNAEEFWSRVAPGEQVAVLRFVAPGYHLSGTIAWIAASSGDDATTANRPGSRAGSQVPLAIFGSFVFAFWLLGYVATAGAGKQWQWPSPRQSPV